MKRKSVTILPLATALGALAGAALPPTAASSAVPADTPATTPNPVSASPALIANTLVSTGEALLGFVVSEQPDGTIIAQHVSHASHASHASHHSHYSSRG
jgi:hypothetical protein